MALLRTYGDRGVRARSISDLSIGAQAGHENAGKKALQAPYEARKRDRKALGVWSDSGPGVLPPPVPMVPL